MQANADRFGENCNREVNICGWVPKQGRTRQRLEIMEHSWQRATFQLQAKAACGSETVVYKVSKLTDKRVANLRGRMGCLSESLRAGGSAIQKKGKSLVTWSPPPPQLCTLQTKWIPMSLWMGLTGDYCSAYVSFDRGWPVWRFCSNLFSQLDSEGWEKHSCW